jgi:hypothetical protein
MKKLFLSLALVATALAFTSCGDDEPNQYQTLKETVVGQDLINSTITMAQNKATYVETADYTFNIERSEKEAKVSVVASGVKFDSRMPIEVSFRMEDIKTLDFDENTISFSAPHVKMYKSALEEEYSGYEITNVEGYIDSKNGVYSLEYIVNGTWRVLVSNKTIRTIVANNDYTAPTELYYTYQIDIATMKAEVFIYNVQFQVGGAMSPVLKKISVPDLDVTATATGLELTGDNIVPVSYSGENLDQPRPMPSMQVTNFKSTLNVRNGDHSIYFNCNGGEHHENKKLYLWE